jgi:probable F420-dependent oxidoreductase
MTLKFIFQYPETNGPDGDLLDSGPLDEVARAVEKAGFHGISLTEHPIPGARWLENGGHQSLDPFAALGYIAAATQQLRLLTYLVCAPYRNPFVLAKAAATVDKLSGGRLILGLGAGYQKSEFYALGVDMDERNVLFDEVLDCLPLHWSGQPFSYQGTHFNARDVRALPRPAQDPIPIWIGGNSKRGRRRVAERAQGWMPMLGSPELARTTQTSMMGSLDDVAVAMRAVREEAAAAGRAETIDLSYPYSDPSIIQPTVEPDRHREALAEIEQAGATWVLVSHPRAEPAATLDFIEAFGATYLI